MLFAEPVACWLFVPMHGSVNAVLWRWSFIFGQRRRKKLLTDSGWLKFNIHKGDWARITLFDVRPRRVKGSVNCDNIRILWVTLYSCGNGKEMVIHTCWHIIISQPNKFHSATWLNKKHHSSCGSNFRFCSYKWTTTDTITCSQHL